jgi:D-arabinose 1-dehydrogenase-like Zn-dependent alcohol dehydrogenase
MHFELLLYDHRSLQFASKMGFKTITIGRGKDKEEVVRKLGARHYIDRKSQTPVEELVKLGGAKIILGTGPRGKAMDSDADLLLMEKTRSLLVYLLVFDL